MLTDSAELEFPFKSSVPLLHEVLIAKPYLAAAARAFPFNGDFFLDGENEITALFARRRETRFPAVSKENPSLAKVPFYNGVCTQTQQRQQQLHGGDAFSFARRGSRQWTASPDRNLHPYP